jgi:MFS family permease
MEEKNKVLYLSCIGIALAWLPWFNYSAVLPILQETYKLSSSDSGSILGAFQLGYVISVLITGLLADRIGKKIILAASSLLIGVGSLGFAFLANDFNSILLWRVIIGIGSGGIYAPGLALLSNWFPAGKRGMAFGAYTGASVTAYAGGYFIAAPIAAASGWQSGIIATSIPVFLAAMVFSLIKEKPDSEPSSRENPKANWRQLSLFTLALLIIAYMAHMWEQFAYWGWAGPFFTASGKVHGFEQSDAIAFGGIMAAITILVGVFAPWLGGMASDRFGRIFTAILFSILSAGFSFTIGWTIGFPLGIIVLAGLGYGFLVVADSAIYKAGLSELLPGRYLALGLSIQSAFGFGAAIFSPKIFGMILDATNPGYFQTEWGWAFISLGIGGLISPLCLILLMRLKR